jgi:hypothetical protein
MRPSPVHEDQMTAADRLAELIERMKRWSEWPDEADCGPVLDAALAELRRHEWQPLETAPKDGTSVLLAAPWGACVGYWGNHFEGIGWMEPQELMPIGDVEGWMPLPDLPPA